MTQTQHTRSFFVTGTDTNVGKTWATLALMYYFKQRGYCVAGMKPIASGCQWDGLQFTNEDALLLQKHSSIDLPYSAINPYALEMPVSPHLAAQESKISVDVIKHAFQQLQQKTEVVIVEGVGGWLVPLSSENDIADLVKALDISVILVVAIKLGCINHARLTMQSITSAGIKCAGWFAVCIDTCMLLTAENITTIDDYMAVPLLGVFPYMTQMDIAMLASHITL